ncbi:hypothetical protein [Photobacterium phosphoreum]|nr:hypothetical protein [Photobacterium phosphoreum]
MLILIKWYWVAEKAEDEKTNNNEKKIKRIIKPIKKATEAA